MFYISFHFCCSHAHVLQVTFTRELTIVYNKQYWTQFAVLILESASCYIDQLTHYMKFISPKLLYVFQIFLCTVYWMISSVPSQQTMMFYDPNTSATIGDSPLTSDTSEVPVSGGSDACAAATTDSAPSVPGQAD